MSSEEYSLTWNNFTENVVNGFSTLLLHGQLCDVTLAVEGELLKAHKVVLSICSPYFQRMFAETQCQHPVIVLKDMRAHLVVSLLQFMYQGSVNVKQSELNAFINIAENLQIKSLATNSNQLKVEAESTDNDNEKVSGATKRSLDADDNSSARAAKSVKMEAEVNVTDVNIDDDDEAQSNEDLLPAVLQISMFESQTCEAKQKNDVTLHSSQSQSQTLDLSSPPEALLARVQTNSGSSNNSSEMNDSDVTMLSPTRLLHGNCIFLKNKTVATQKDTRIHWVCKNYTVSKCSARCTTLQGKFKPPTREHNHAPHMSREQPPTNGVSACAMPPPSTITHHSQNPGHARKRSNSTISIAKIARNTRLPPPPTATASSSNTQSSSSHC